MRDTLNILFLTSWYPTKVDTQNGNFIQQHARAVSQVCTIYVLHAISRVQNEDFVIESGFNKNVFETILRIMKTKTYNILGLIFPLVLPAKTVRDISCAGQAIIACVNPVSAGRLRKN